MHAVLGPSAIWLVEFEPPRINQIISEDLGVYYVAFDLPDGKAAPNRSATVARELTSAIKSIPRVALRAYATSEAANARWPAAALEHMRHLFAAVSRAGNILELAPTEELAVGKELISGGENHTLVVPPYADCDQIASETTSTTTIMNGLGLRSLLYRFLEIANRIAQTKLAATWKAKFGVSDSLVVILHDRRIATHQVEKVSAYFRSCECWLTFITASREKRDALRRAIEEIRRRR